MTRLSDAEKQQYWLRAFEATGAQILYNQLWRVCFDMALDSDCEKMGFGAIAVRGNIVVAKAHNGRNPLFASMCEGECIRNSIESRTQSQLGACDHAEERVIDELEGVAGLVDLYVAGIYPNKLPYLKTEAVWTCDRCARAINRKRSKIGRVFVPLPDGWQPIPPKDIASQAIKYSLGASHVEETTFKPFPFCG